MSDIIPFPKKKHRKPISSDDYIDALDSIEMMVEEVHPDCLEIVRKILVEMRFCAALNPQFREETRDQLEELVDDLYAETQARIY